MARKPRQKKLDEAAAEKEVVNGDDFDVESAWRKARLVARSVLDTYAPAIDALIPIFKDEVPTMAVDKWYRCYIGKAYVQKLYKAAEAVSGGNPCEFCGATAHHPLAYIAGDIYHESQHPLRRHHKRFDEMNFTDHSKGNIAMDMEIDDDFLTLAQECHKHNPKFPIPCYYPGNPNPLPSKQNLEENHIWEWYYHNIPDDPSETCGKAHGDSYNPGGKNWDPGSAPPEAPSHGSGATGQAAPWEEGQPCDGGVAGLTEADQEAIESQVAKNIMEAHKRGDTALGGMLDWAKERMPKSTYDWKKEFRRITPHEMRKAFGYSRRTYRKLHKRSAATNYEVVYPGTYATQPKINVLLDCSGSMFCEDRLVQGVAELDKMISALKAKTTLFCADAETYEPQTVQSIRDIKLRGGGGTSMRRCMQPVVEHALANETKLIVLVTDGETDYPTEEEMRGVALIVCRINANRNSHWGETVPSFAKDIYIPPHGGKIIEDR